MSIRDCATFVLAAATLSAGAASWALVPPEITITAECGGGTPAAFGPGAHASDRDGSIYRLDWANGHSSHKVARDAALVGRWRNALEEIGFERVEYDHSNQPWCGIVRAVEGKQHAVRWPADLDANGNLRHRFEGMPPQIWFVYLEMQKTAIDQEACTVPAEARETAVDARGEIAVHCAGLGAEPARSSVRVLADGDVVATRSEPNARQCSTVVAHNPSALGAWQSVLDSAEFESLPDHAPRSPFDGGCSLERTRAGETHTTRLGPGRPADRRWASVDTVVNELAAFAQGRLQLTAAGQGGEVTRVALLDAFTARSIADADVLVSSDNGMRCIAAPCPQDEVSWRGRSDAQGVVSVPSRFVAPNTRIETYAHGSREIEDAARDRSNSLALELIPLELPLRDPLGLPPTPHKLVDAQSGEPIANASVRLAARGTAGLTLRSNALGYIFVDDEAFDLLTENLEVSIQGYRRRTLGYDEVVSFLREFR